MEQTKALNALEPFLALSKSASSPRAAADLVTRVTSAPGTFVFAELLQTPQIQALAESPDFSSYLDLLHVFSYGTYQTYRATPNLPNLSEAQSFKLRQLSLLTLARDRANLSYSALQQALGLSSARELEDLVIKAVYDGLLHATLDPASQAVQVTGIAPLRDLQPGSIPDMIAALNVWSDRCTSTLADLETQIRNVRSAAAARDREARAADEKMHRLMGELKDPDKLHDLQARDNMLRRGLNKRSMLETGNPVPEESMELDDPYPEDLLKRANKRKM